QTYSALHFQQTCQSAPWLAGFGTRLAPMYGKSLSLKGLHRALPRSSRAEPGHQARKRCDFQLLERRNHSSFVDPEVAKVVGNLAVLHRGGRKIRPARL